MILTCPECDTRFVVPSTIFMRGGRKLRCSSCKHSWFQEEPMERADNATAQPSESKNDKTSFFNRIKQDFQQGYVLIGGVFALVLIAFFTYKFLTPSIVIGQGLAFDNITIERDGTTLTLNGEIVNAMDSDRGVPSIKITRVLANDIEGDATIISPDKDVLHSGEMLPINASLDGVGPEVLNVKLGFNLAQDKTEETNSDPHSEH
jgi:predicted Zn finger-like uncharacterized protein